MEQKAIFRFAEIWTIRRELWVLMYVVRTYDPLLPTQSFSYWFLRAIFPPRFGVRGGVAGCRLEYLWWGPKRQKDLEGYHWRCAAQNTEYSITEHWKM